MKKWVFPAVALMVLSAASCGKKEAAKTAAPEPAAVASASKDVVEDFLPVPGQYGVVTECPVMKEKVVIGKDTKALKYKGKEYYLCCPSCYDEFKKNPEKYAK